jgi:light-harvesting protein B-800-850 alpha chain
VVHPTVGLPLLLGSVAVTSLVVHACVMTHTTWMSNYWQGAARPKTADIGSTPSLASVTPNSESAFKISVAPVAGIPGKTESSFVITVAPNPAATTASSEATPPASKSVTVAAAKLE